MFFDKILDFFKIDREDDKTYFSSYHKASENLVPPSNNLHECDDPHDHIYEIFDYWRCHSYSREPYIYSREASHAEKQEYALIDILSCFSKGARNLDNFSLIRLHNLGITNWKSYTQRLISNGYIVQADIIDTLIASYNLKELKTIAESVGVKKTGTKSELSQRIASVLSSSDVNRILNESPLYIISEKGNSLIEGNEDYVLLHKYLHFVSLAEFNDNRIPNGGRYRRNFYDTMFQILSNRKFFYEINGNFEDAGLTALHLGNLMIEEYKKTTHNVPLSVILANYIEHIYVYSCYCFEANCSLKDGIFSNTYTGYTLPYLTKESELLSNQEPYINYDMLFMNKPPSFFTQSEFKQCIHEMLTSPMFDKQKWDYKLQTRIEEFENAVKGEL